jgi:hypothetical protein
MTLREMLMGLTLTGPAREGAARCLRDRLDHLCRGDLRRRNRGVTVTIDESLRDDAVQAVLITLLGRPPIPVLDQGEGAISAYLETMLVNWRLTMLRRTGDNPSKRAAEFDVERATGPRTTDRDRLGDREPAVVASMWELLERAHQKARARRDHRYHEEFDLAWRQVKDLCHEELGMDEILARDEGVGPATPAPEWKRAQDRTLTAHSRLRKALLALADDPGDDLTRDDADLLRMVCQLLFRCQKKPGGPSKGQGAES